ncbi:MAG: outer membrane beta-barrel protein [Nostocaceae cyanobacterium]|nr:outer membrane beta-barrel protein [Nostocaceae cyanobacterium]
MKIKLIVFFVLLLSSNLHSSEWMTELRGGYFYPTSKKFREIYKDGGLEGEVEFSKTYRENLIVWGNINYFQRKGRSLGFHDKTTLNMIPISLGLKYQFLSCSCISPYLGAGLSYTFLNIKNDSEFAKRHVTKGSFGFVLKSGTYINLSEKFLLDLFLDYYYQEVHFYSKHKVDVGGLRMGMGLGYRF